MVPLRHRWLTLLRGDFHSRLRSARVGKRKRKVWEQSPCETNSSEHPFFRNIYADAFFSYSIVRKSKRNQPLWVDKASVKHLLQSEGCDRSTVPTNSPEMTFCLAFSFQTFIQASRNSAGYSLGSILIWLEQKNHVRVVIHKPWKWSYLESKSRLDISDSPAGDVESVSAVGNWIIHAVLLQSSLTSLWSHLSKALDFSLGPWLSVTKT